MKIVSLSFFCFWRFRRFLPFFLTFRIFFFSFFHVNLELLTGLWFLSPNILRFYSTYLYKHVSIISAVFCKFSFLLTFLIAQMKFVAIILVLSAFFNAIFRFTLFFVWPIWLFVLETREKQVAPSGNFVVLEHFSSVSVQIVLEIYTYDVKGGSYRLKPPTN